MKKRWYLLLALPLVLGAPTVLSSCGDDEPDPIEKPNNPDTPNTPGDNNQGETKLDSESQKLKLQATAQKFMKEVPADEMRNLSQLADYVNDAYIDNSKFSNDVVTDWFEELIDSNLSPDGKPDGKDDFSKYWRKEYYKRIIELSQFKGKFVAGKEGWTKSNADDLQFEFKDQNGITCVLTLKTSGKTAKVYVGETWGDSYYEKINEVNGEEYWKWVYKIEKNYVYVPEHITTTLLQGGNTLVSAEVNIDHSQFSGPEYDLSKDAVSTNATVKINNYVWVIDRAAHNSKEGSAYVKGSMSKAGKTLVSFEASAADTKLDEDGELLQGGAAKVSVNILDEVQIKGTCSNVKTFADYMDKADQFEENESQFKSYVNQANSLLNLGIYFNGGSMRQAKVQLECFEDGYAYEKYWTYEPVLVFDDNSTYSTFTAFFNETSFREVINSFEDLVRSYEKLIEFAN